LRGRFRIPKLELKGAEAGALVAISFIRDKGVSAAWQGRVF
jgi:hypothetical protein